MSVHVPPSSAANDLHRGGAGAGAGAGAGGARRWEEGGKKEGEERGGREEGGGRMRGLFAA
eukprot:2792846-Rhodomonas_salina.1